MLLSFQSSSVNPFSPIGPLIPSAKVNLGLPHFLLSGGYHFITSFGSLSSSILWTCPYHWSCLVLILSKSNLTTFIFCLICSVCRRRLHLSRVSPMGFLAIFFFRWAGSWPAASTPNLEEQVIFDQGFLPLALDTPVYQRLQGSSANFGLPRLFYFPGTPPYPVNILLSATRGGTQWKTSNSSRAYYFLAETKSINISLLNS